MAAAGASRSPKLGTYRRKRDFTRTPEPSGRARDRARGPAALRRAAAPRPPPALRLPLEIDGVLASWAVPKGPTLDPAVRRAAIHVEDHPIEYFDFEGVIPAGEYGGGDVIVWDCGHWPRRRTTRPSRGRRRRAARRTATARSSRPVRPGPNQPGGLRQEQWLLLHKHDDVRRRRAGIPRTTRARCCPDGPTTRSPPIPSGCGARTCRPSCRRSRSRVGSPSGPSADELAALDALATAGTWHVFGRSLRVTNLDKVLFPARGRERPIDKREFLRYTARIAPTLLPYLTGRPLNMHRYPNGANGRASGTRSSRRTLRTGSPGGTTRPPRPTRRVRTSWSRNRPPGLGGELRRARVAPVDLHRGPAGPRLTR